MIGRKRRIFEAEEQEVDKTTKNLRIEWGGLKVGPIYCLANSGTRPEEVFTAETDELTQKVRQTPEWNEACQQPNPTDAVQEVMKSFAEQNGYEVVSSVYDEWESQAVNEAMTAAQEEEFLAALKKGEVEFSYKKVDGSTRHAVGTLNPELMKISGFTEKKLEDGKKKRLVPPTIIVYWDLEPPPKDGKERKPGFCSFRKENFISFKVVDDGSEEENDEENEQIDEGKGKAIGKLMQKFMTAKKPKPSRSIMDIGKKPMNKEDPSQKIEDVGKRPIAKKTTTTEIYAPDEEIVDSGSDERYM